MRFEEVYTDWQDKRQRTNPVGCVRVCQTAAAATTGFGLRLTSICRPTNMRTFCSKTGQAYLSATYVFVGELKMCVKQERGEVPNPSAKARIRPQDSARQRVHRRLQ